MTLFLILALIIVITAVIAGGGMFASRGRTTHIIDRTYVSEPVDEVIEEPVATRRVRRRRIVR